MKASRSHEEPWTPSEGNGKPARVLSRYRARAVLGKCHCGDSE